MVCRICNRECRSFSSLSIHCSKTHKIYPKEYYDGFLKKEGDGVCRKPGCDKETNFKNLNLGYFKYHSSRCSNSDKNVKLKKRLACLSKYGVDNPSKSEEIKEKKKNTCLKNFGVNNPGQSAVIRNKVKQTCLERFGFECPAQSKVVKEKAKITCLENFGVEYPMQSKEVRDKSKKTMLCRYRVEHPAQLKEVRDKMGSTCLKNFGVEFSLQSKEVRDKSKKTCLKNFGVEYPSQATKVKDKKKQTCLERYGVEFSLQSKEVRDKSKKTCLENYGVDSYSKTDVCRNTTSQRMKNGGAAHANSFVKNPSEPQIELFQSVKEFYTEAVLEYPCLNYRIDVAIPSLKIAIEYDGSYWHKDEEKDKKRQLDLESEGWKFIRYKDYIPTPKELAEDLSQIILKETR